MIRRTLITLLLFVIAIGGALAWKYWPRTVPWEECSELYRHYAHADGIQAAYLHNYKVNDTLTIEATLLEATDSISWSSLKNNFKINNPSDQGKQAMARGEDNLEIGKLDIDNDLYKYDICVASHRDRYIAIFHTSDQSQKDIIMEIIINKIFNALITNKNYLNNEKSL